MPDLPEEAVQLEDSPDVARAILRTRDEFVELVRERGQGPGIVGPSWVEAVQKHMVGDMRYEAAVAAVATANEAELNPDSLSRDGLSRVTDEHIMGLEDYGNFLASVAWKNAETADTPLTSLEALETQLSDRSMAILADRTIRQLWNGVVDIVLATAAPAVIQAQGVAASPFDRTKQWNTMQDDRVRSAHAEAQGQTVPVSGVFTIGGQFARYPGDPVLPPELRINCRCFLTPGGADPSEWLERVRRQREGASGQQVLPLEPPAPGSVPTADPSPTRPSSGGVPERPRRIRGVLQGLLERLRRLLPAGLPLLRDLDTDEVVPPDEFAARWAALAHRPDSELPEPTLDAVERFGALRAHQRVLLEELGVKANEFEMTQILKEDAGFEKGAGAEDRRCGDCVHYAVQRANTCDLVSGDIAVGDVCDFWQDGDMEAVEADGQLPNQETRVRRPPLASFVHAGPDHTGTGIMVCVRPNRAEAEALSFADGLPVDDIHLTIGYFGSTDEHGEPSPENTVFEEIVLAVQEAALQIGAAELRGEVSTVAVFEANEDRPMVALVDAPGLAELRGWVLWSLEGAGREALHSDHDFQPHITLGYEPDEAELEEALSRVGQSVTFDALELQYGDESIVVPLGQGHGDEDDEGAATVRATPRTQEKPRPQRSGLADRKRMTFQSGSTLEKPGRKRQMAEDPGDLAEGQLVIVDALSGMIGGVIDAVLTEGEVPGPDDASREATEDQPIFAVRIWMYDEDQGEWFETEEIIGYLAAELTVVEEFPVPQAEGDGEEPEADEAAQMAEGDESDDEDDESENARRAEAGEFEWEGVLVPEGTESGDRRFIAEGGLTWRDLPLTLMAQFQNPETGGHALAVPAGSIWEIERVGNDIVARGFFDSGQAGETLRRMMDEGTIKGVSVDIDMVRSETRFEDDDEEPLLVLLEGRIMGATATAFPAFQEAILELIEVPESQARTLVAAGWIVWQDAGAYFVTEDGVEAIELAATGDRDLPIAARDLEWDAGAAQERMQAMCRDDEGELDGSCFSSGHFYRDDDGDPELVESYKFPFADVIDGRLHAVFQGVSAVAGRLGESDISEDDKEQIRGAVNGYYERFRDAFDDPDIESPFEQEAKVE